MKQSARRRKVPDLVFALVLYAGFGNAVAGTVVVPLNLDYAVVRKALIERVFVGPDESLRVATAGRRCNNLIMAHPELGANDDGTLSIRVDVTISGGAPIGTRCVMRFNWQGRVALRELVALDDANEQLTFRVIDSKILRTDGQTSVPDVLWRWIKRFGHPYIETFRIDLSTMITGLGNLLQVALPQAVVMDPAHAFNERLQFPSATAQALRVELAFDIPTLADEPLPAPAPLTERELAAWDAHWQAWDSFATWAIRFLALVAGDDLRRGLLDTLVQARYELRDALIFERGTEDPVRQLFTDTWQRLAPLVAQAGRQLDSATALSYLAFISGGDALAAIDASGERAGLRISRGTLLEFARSLAPDIVSDDIEYTLEPDPVLRRLFGFPDEFTTDIPPAAKLWIDPFIAPARAASAAADLVERLNSWAPQRDDIDAYLEAVNGLLSDVEREERERGKIPLDVAPVYAALLRATAWQETCWRQFIDKQGTLQPIRSSAGSIGLMQVNQHVWRGIYDIERLGTDIGYNARAGNEILVHYLVDYAIRKREHEITGSLDNLARATYAVYNGGPGHLKRYRQDDTKPGLRAIDDAFWRKYTGIQSEGVSAVRRCYGD
ncbi:MAG: hypothetical protein ACU85U_16210 [Gammaproteobacteria bacterium]